VDPAALPRHHRQGDGAQPGDERRPAHVRPFRLAQNRVKPIFGRSSAPRTRWPRPHEQQAVLPTKSRSFVKTKGEQAMSVVIARRRGSRPARPVRGDDLEGEPRPVRVGFAVVQPRSRPRGPRRRPGPGSQRPPSRAARAVSAPRTRPRAPITRADPGHVVADEHAKAEKSRSSTSSRAKIAMSERPRASRGCRSRRTPRRARTRAPGHVLGGALPDRLVGDRQRSERPSIRPSAAPRRAPQASRSLRRRTSGPSTASRRPRTGRDA